MKPSHAEGDADVAVLRTHVVIDGANPGVLVGRTLDEFGGLGAHFGARLHSFVLQRAVPASNFLPALKAGELDLRGGSEAAGSLILDSFTIQLFLLRSFALQVRTRDQVKTRRPVFFR